MMKFYKGIIAIHVLMALICGIGTVGLFENAVQQLEVQIEQRESVKWIVRLNPEQLTNIDI